MLIFRAILISSIATTVAAPVSAEIAWNDVLELGVDGQAWSETKAPFDRLPAKAESMVRDAVWNLSRHSAGLCVRFVSDAPEIHARWTLTSGNLAMPHMPATGVSGVDLYVKTKEGTWRWLAVGRPTKQSNSARLVQGLPKAEREYRLYLPLYNGVSSVEVGIPEESTIKKAPTYPRGHDKPIVFYGTSITQGGCASRPGMVHTAILGRRLNYPVVNLGFSGNGRMELEIARLLTEIDAAVYVIDCLPNLNAEQVTARTQPLVKIIRAKRPRTPILLVEDRTYADAFLNSARRQRNDTNRAALWQEYKSMLTEGIGGLHYLPGKRLLGEDGEDTVDGSHPTDLGFMRQANAIETALRPLLTEPTPESEIRPIDGYTDQLSYLPGEEVHFHVSTKAKSFSIEIAREGATREVVFKEENLPGKFHPIPVNASSHGCGWPVAWSLKVPEDWKSGYYVCRLTAEQPDGKPTTTEAFFIVRPAQPGKNAKILLQLATNTYNAYTNWGGYSLYAYHGRDNVQGRRVSFNRPLRSLFNRWELQFVRWAEKNGYALDYCANSDLEFHPELLKHYRLVLSVGHDEYWSAPMRDHLEKFIADGGNVAFFSGNTCCWQVRSEEGGRALTCWKQTYQQDPFFDKGEHHLLSSLWSHHLVDRPENQLTGVGFLWGGYHRSHGQFMDGPGSFIVHRPDHWLFEGTDLKRDDRFGGAHTIVGYECDGCELVWKDGIPTPTYADGTPKSFRVVATCPARWHPDDSEWYERWEKGRTGNAVMGVYERGGTVVTVGTTDWSHGLAGADKAVEQITRNVLDRLGK